MKTTILTKKLNAGHFTVTVFSDNKEIGSFETTDMQLVDDIQEMNSDGLENELKMFESFDEVMTYCVKKVNIAKMRDEYPFGQENHREHMVKYDGTSIR